MNNREFIQLEKVEDIEGGFVIATYVHIKNGKTLYNAGWRIKNGCWIGFSDQLTESNYEARVWIQNYKLGLYRKKTKRNED